MFKYYNANPLDDIESDCVCRAISRALNLDYYEVERKLILIAELFGCETLCVCCYKHLLENVYDLKPQMANGATVGGISRAYRDDIVLIRIDGHLTVSEHGMVYDLWDCTEEVADIYWVVK